MERLVAEVYGGYVEQQDQDRVQHALEHWVSNRGLTPQQALYAWEHDNDLLHFEFHNEMHMVATNGGDRPELKVVVSIERDD